MHEPLEDAAGDVHAGILGRGREDRADHEHHGVADEHPALREVLGELDGEHGANCVGGVGEAGAEAQRLLAHVQLLADDRRQRLERGREREVGDQREHHHRGNGGIAARERALA